MKTILLIISFFVLVCFDLKKVFKKKEKNMIIVYSSLIIAGNTLWILYLYRIGVPSINKMITTIVEGVF